LLPTCQDRISRGDEIRREERLTLLLPHRLMRKSR